MTSLLPHGCMTELGVSVVGVLVAPQGQHCGGIVAVADTVGRQ